MENPKFFNTKGPNDSNFALDLLLPRAAPGLFTTYDKALKHFQKDNANSQIGKAIESREWRLQLKDARHVCVIWLFKLASRVLTQSLSLPSDQQQE